MKTDHKKNSIRKEQQRHQPSAVIVPKQQQPAESDSYSEASSPAAAQVDQEIKGKDIDLMNYTDL